MNATMLVMGILCVVFPTVDCLSRFGAGRDAICRYFASLTLQQILLLRGLTVSGVFLISFAIIMPR